MLFRKKNIPLTDLFPDGFVDIHSHLLPGIDDGAKDLDTSIALIEKMANQGMVHLITTPHVLGDVYPNSTENILSTLEMVRKELQERGLDYISIRAAAEYMLDEQFAKRLASNDLLFLKDKYILVEMSYSNAPFNLYELLFEIQLKGYKPVLAHPERYIFYHTDFENYYKLKKAGCLFQMNLLSLTQQYGKNIQKTCTILLENNFYDFVGTDVHHSNHIDALQEIGTRKIERSIRKLLENNKRFL